MKYVFPCNFSHLKFYIIKVQILNNKITTLSNLQFHHTGIFLTNDSYFLKFDPENHALLFNFQYLHKHIVIICYLVHTKFNFYFEMIRGEILFEFETFY